MYGIGLFKGLGITMKNLVSPGRQFNVHQYPNRKASPLDLAKISDSNAFAFIAANPIIITILQHKAHILFVLSLFTFSKSILILGRYRPERPP